MLRQRTNGFILPSLLNVNQTSQALDAMEKSGRIVCMCHANPDGDAVGSLLGLVSILQKKYPEKNILAICKDPAPDSFRYLPGVREITPSYVPTSGDLFLSLDSGDAKQTGYLEELPELFDPKRAKEKGIVTMKLDHHHTGSDFAEFNFVDSTAASTAEIVVDVADALNFEIPKDAATCLLTGIFTDTGSMMHSNTSTRVYRTAARLLKAGADHGAMTHHVFRTSKLSTLKLWGRMLEKISLSEEGAAISAVTAGDFRATGADFSELTGAIDYVNSIPGMKFSLILSERDGKVKGSLRTLRDDVDVSAMAKKFDGGGHKRAAGFSVDGKLEEETRWKVVPSKESLQQK
ncbi:MAG TPA: bifunctional oligoribonuclease/PAP phosphatase NrnA [Candidatus Peribacterales bacterium]|nr:bifunctional oligoribonuclease/PAP phosphatase NrnA [Candidatus Peribacterales bacterium]